jgi:hypothetical protein
MLDEMRTLADLVGRLVARVSVHSKRVAWGSIREKGRVLVANLHVESLSRGCLKSSHAALASCLFNHVAITGYEAMPRSCWVVKAKATVMLIFER